MAVVNDCAWRLARTATLEVGYENPHCMAISRRNRGLGRMDLGA